LRVPSFVMVSHSCVTLSSLPLSFMSPKLFFRVSPVEHWWCVRVFLVFPFPSVFHANVLTFLLSESCISPTSEAPFSPPMLYFYGGPLSPPCFAPNSSRSFEENASANPPSAYFFSGWCFPLGWFSIVGPEPPHSPSFRFDYSVVVRFVLSRSPISG